MDKVACPTCNKKISWDLNNAFRPFCSERCKLLDLGAWADGTYAIPAEEVDPNDLDQYLDKPKDEEVDD
jgi:endogenous inhibitor of DNA gyrase (YacG/DUF329 family)